MGAGPVTADAQPSQGWRLEPKTARDAQGFVVSPFAHLQYGEALFLTLPPGIGGGWLAALRAQITITDATGQASPSATIAFAYSGLRAMNLDADTLATFADPFREGMHQEDRRRRLKDDGPTVIEGGAVWSADTANAVLVVYEDDEAALAALCAKASAILRVAGAPVAFSISLSLRFDEKGIAREHFGFADGLSQPVPYGPEILGPSGGPAPKDLWHPIAAGDILFGHINAHDEPAPGPLVKVPEGTACGLPPSQTAEGYRDLGVNGSYLVIRELRQDVARFWTSMDQAAAALGDPTLPAEALAARVVGRTADGDPLVPGGTLPPVGGQPANTFGFLATDPHGVGCPIGSHIRRANPRDGLAPDPQSALDLLKAANNHRILRRGRKFGPPIADPRVDDQQSRGLLFMCLNTDLVRQFEFVQQNWLLNPTFATLFNETDPLMGPKGPFTIPAQPIRRRATVETFIHFAGGDYYFLPSLPALDYLGGLK
ncbi:MAG: hypothetical protein P4L64_02745 [Caulobacteraceae bacterium]|nr:hypothetical protein [Caulobacteraceae bacterium]